MGFIGRPERVGSESRGLVLVVTKNASFETFGTGKGLIGYALFYHVSRVNRTS